MRTYRIICFLFDPNTGGPVVRARAVYARMVAQGHTVRLAQASRQGTAAAYLAEAGLEVDRLSIPKPVPPSKPWEFLKFCIGALPGIWAVRRYLRTQRPDVVHVNGAIDIVPALGARLAGVPVVWHLNDTILGPRPSRLLGRLVRRVASLVVAAAGRVGDHYAIPKEARMIMHAPVDTDLFAARDPAPYPRPAPRLLLIGNWNWVKGQHHFVDLIRRLRAQGMDVRGMVAGRFLDSQTTFWRPIMQDIQTSGLETVIETPGFVENTRAALGDSDMLILTSHSEASPIAVLEAMSVGVPQVVFDVGGVREMMGEGQDASGIIVDRQDVDAMAHAVAKILSDKPFYDRLARKGQERARQMFSLETCVAKHSQAYARATGKGPDAL